MIIAKLVNFVQIIVSPSTKRNTFLLVKMNKVVAHLIVDTRYLTSG